MRKHRACCRNRLLRHGPRPRGFLAFVQKRPRPAQQAGSFPRATSFSLHVGPAGRRRFVLQFRVRRARRRREAAAGPGREQTPVRASFISPLHAPGHSERPARFCFPRLHGGQGRVVSFPALAPTGFRLSLHLAGFSPRVTLPAPNSPPPQGGRAGGCVPLVAPAAISILPFPYLTSLGSRPVSLRMFSSTFLRLSLAFSSCSCKVLTATAIFSPLQASRRDCAPGRACCRAARGRGWETTRDDGQLSPANEDLLWRFRIRPFCDRKRGEAAVFGRLSQ